MSANSWFSIPSPQPSARFRLFCFPHAGGGASAYFSWSRALAGQPIEVAAVQLPGRENRLKETPYTDLGSLVASLGLAIDPLSDRPFAFFGHSMGALVAFELTRWLRARALSLPTYLFASGSRAPHLKYERTPLHTIAGDEEFLAAVAGRYGGIPNAVAADREFRALVAPTLRADLRMNESYEYRDGAPLSVNISAYGGSGDLEVSRESLDGWRDQTTAAFSLRLFPGDHFFLGGARDALLADVVERTLRR